MDKNKRVLPALTGVRFFLAFWVVAYHQESSLDGLFQPGSPVHRAFSSVLHTGYAAVSAFFILSGFVLTYNYDLDTLALRSKLKKFGVARFSRIYPAYLAGLILVLPFAAYRVFHGFAIDSTGGLLSLVLNLTLLQAWVPDTALTWNYPGWSLSNEAFFYAMLPFIGAPIYRLGSRGTLNQEASLPRLTAIAAVFWLCSLALPLFTVFAPVHGFGDAPGVATDFAGAGIWPGLVRYNPLLRLPEFCMGILLARIYRSIPAEHPLRNRGARLYLPAILLALVVLMNGYWIPYPPLHNGLLAPLYAVIILGFALEGGLLSRLLSTPLLIFLGNASYSMYILHAPIYSWLSIIFRRLFLIPADGAIWFVTYLVFVTAVSAIFYQLIEEPSHKWLRRRLTAWTA